jgi:hypothetical protein
VVRTWEYRRAAIGTGVGESANGLRVDVSDDDQVDVARCQTGLRERLEEMTGRLVSGGGELAEPRVDEHRLVGVTDHEARARSDDTASSL